MTLSPFLIFIILVIVAAVVLGANAGKNEEREALKRIRDSFGHAGSRSLSEKKYSLVKAYYEKLKDPQDIDDITWEDLKLDRIYDLINHSESSAGDAVLYLRLRQEGRTGDHTVSPEVWLEDKETAFRYLMAARKLGYMRSGSLSEFLDRIVQDTGVSVFWYAILDILMVSSLIFMFFVPSYGVLLFLGSVFISVIHGSLSHRDLTPYLSGMAFVRRLRDCLKEVSEVLPSGYGREREEISAFVSSSAGFYRTSLLLGSGDGSLSFGALEVIMSYVRMLTGVDVFAFSGAVKELRGIRDQVSQAFITFGRIESDISAASFREYLGDQGCVPEFVEEAGSGLSIQGLYHPLLENPVKNDIIANRSILVTGANASGKSTFLRACAISVILAQTVGTVPADSYKGQRFRVLSSMTVSDDLLKGDSYYVAEVKAIKRILEALPAVSAENSGGPRILCFLDEVLRGTNTPERISAGTAILRALSRRGALCFAATHDLELTQLLSDDYENYYFSENTGEESFTFEYKIRRGVSRDTNAIKLLVYMGFDSEITDEAIDMAMGFMKDK